LALRTTYNVGDFLLRLGWQQDGGLFRPATAGRALKKVENDKSLTYLKGSGIRARSKAKLSLDWREGVSNIEVDFERSEKSASLIRKRSGQLRNM